MLATPDGDREATPRYLTHLAERTSAAETSSAVAEVLTEVAAPRARRRAPAPAPDHRRSPVAPHAPAPISHRLKPRLATALFRRYLRACVPTGPNRVARLADAGPEAAPAQQQRVAHRHPH